MRKAAATAVVLGTLALVASCADTAGDADTAADSTGAMGFDSPDTVADRDVPPAGPITTDDGCAAIPEAEAERAIGFDVVMNDNATGNCVLTPASGEPSAPAFDFRVEPRAAAFDYFSAQPDATPIAGLGERAVWATLNEMTGYIVVVTGGNSVVVAVAKSDGLTMESRRQAEALARLLL